MRRYCLSRIKSVSGIPTGNDDKWSLWCDSPMGWIPFKRGTFKECVLERLKEEGIYIC